MRWNARAAAAIAAVGLGFVTFRTAEAQRSAGNTAAGAGAAKPTLTAMDYIEIQQLVARYPFELNSSRDNGYAMADLFTDDAIFCGRLVLFSQGREAIAALARGRRGGSTTLRTAHFSTNHIIEPSPEGAIGKQYLVVLNIGEDGRPSSVNQGGHYDDVYVKTPKGWRFKLRNYMPSGWSPPQPCAPPPTR
jgi:hypothetical protein